MGADEVVDYRKQNWSSVLAADSVDLVFDNFGEDPAAMMRVLKAPGLLVSITESTAPHPKPGVRQVNVEVNSSSHADLDALSKMVADGQLRPHVAKAFALSDIPAAFNYSQGGRVTPLWVGLCDGKTECRAAARGAESFLLGEEGITLPSHRRGEKYPLHERRPPPCAETRIMFTRAATSLALLGAALASTPPQVELEQNVSNVPAPYLLQWPPKPPYNHTTKELGNTASAAECQAKCIAYYNADASPVSGWSRCESFTWLLGGRCVAVVDAAEWNPQPEEGAVTGRLTWPPAPCSSDADCSYNGVCASKLCKCDSAWKGDRCQTLALLPTTRDAGLRLVDGGTNTSSWGGGVLLDSSTGLYHMWASEMLSHCGIDSWTTNSHVIHATSTDGIHFTRKEEVWPAFSHEPNVIRAPTGEWVMYWTALAKGQPKPPVCNQCHDGVTPAAAQCVHAAGGTGPTYMSVAKSPDGPWSTPQMLFESERKQTNMDTNLAVVILKNGSAVGIGRTGGGPTGIIAHLVTAGDWKDPSSYTGRWRTMLFPNTTIMPDAGVEDPHVYGPDRNGIIHAVFHNQIQADDERLCGGHAYTTPESGYTEWVFTGTSWSNRVEFKDSGYTYTFSRRERPHVIFGDKGTVAGTQQASTQSSGSNSSSSSSGSSSDSQGSKEGQGGQEAGRARAADPFKITGLTTGVQYGPASPVSVPGEDACYTVYQPVQG
eukprot:g992.t1